MIYYKHWKKFVNKMLAENGWYNRDSKLHKKNCRIKYVIPNVTDGVIKCSVRAVPIETLEDIDLTINFDEESDN